jgi:hypothetical protein
MQGLQSSQIALGWSVWGWNTTMLTSSKHWKSQRSAGISVGWLSWFGTVWSVAASCSRTRCHQLLRARQAQRVEHQTRKRARFSTGLPSIPHSACSVADFGFVAFAIRAVFISHQGETAENMA